MSNSKESKGEINVLIVDDQAGVRQLIAEVLREDGQRILMAENGRQALALLREEKIDLILLDMKMPGMNGLETYKKIKDHGFTGSVIMMTAYGEVELREQAKELGISSFLIKPFDIMELKQAVYACGKGLSPVCLS